MSALNGLQNAVGGLIIRLGQFGSHKKLMSLFSAHKAWKSWNPSGVFAEKCVCMLWSPLSTLWCIGIIVRGSAVRWKEHWRSLIQESREHELPSYRAMRRMMGVGWTCTILACIPGACQNELRHLENLVIRWSHAKLNMPYVRTLLGFLKQVTKAETFTGGALRRRRPFKRPWTRQMFLNI